MKKWFSFLLGQPSYFNPGKKKKETAD